MLVNPVISNVIQIIDVITNLYLDIERKVIWLRSSSSSSSSSSNLLLRPEAIPACITRPLSHCRKSIFCRLFIFLPLKSLAITWIIGEYAGRTPALLHLHAVQGALMKGRRYGLRFSCFDGLVCVLETQISIDHYCLFSCGRIVDDGMRRSGQRTRLPYISRP